MNIEVARKLLWLYFHQDRPNKAIIMPDHADRLLEAQEVVTREEERRQAREEGIRECIEQIHAHRHDHFQNEEDQTNYFLYILQSLLNQNNNA